MTPILDRVVQVQRMILALPKPVVARVHGAVRAGGLGLVAASDLAIAAESATFALTEVKLGLTPAAVSLTVLPRLQSRAASEYLLTGRVFGAPVGEAIGLVTRAVPDASLGSTVDGAVNDLLAASPQGLRATKALLNAPLLQDIDVLGDELVQLSADLFDTGEAQQAIAQFVR